MRDGPDPRLILQIPLHGFANTGLKGVSGTPAEFAVDFRGINGITTIMTGAVGDEGDEAAGVSTDFRLKLVDEIAHELHEVKVRLLVVAADVVGLAELAVGQHGPEGFAVVADIKPVADVHAIAVNGDRLAGEDALDDDGDQLLRELIRAVVVRAVRDDCRQTVGVVVGANEEVTGGLGGRVRRIGGVRRCFGEEARFAKRAENFVSAHVKEPGGSILDA